MVILGEKKASPHATSAKGVQPTRVETDPRPRRDRRCIVRGCRKLLPVISLNHLDPFCSSRCCRRWYGCPLHTDDDPRTLKAEANRAASRTAT